MAIGTDATIDFFGATDTVLSSPSNIADTNFQGSSAWTNDDDAPFAMFRLQTACSVAPAQGAYVNLYARPLNVDSTNDMPVPDASFAHLWLGAFPLDTVTATQEILLGPVRLPNFKTSSEYEFYIENRTGQTMTGASTNLAVTPMTYGPHP